MRSAFPLFTSIKPPASADELAYLRTCLGSWRAVGFDPVAVNGPAEMAALRKLDLKIAFAATTAEGKPRIGAILSAIRDHGAQFAGIINSDCRIVAYPDLVTNLSAGLERTVVLAWRIDLGCDLEPVPRRGGFDAYFFDTAVLPEDDCWFSIGETWWDYWFPLACEVNGARLETLALPLLTHLAHEGESGQGFIRAGYRFWSQLQTWNESGKLPMSLLVRLPPIGRKLPADEIYRLAAIIPAWLHGCRPQTIAIMGPQAAEIETLLRFGGRAYLKDSQSSVATLAARLKAIESSTSWRMTAPLRRAVTAVRSSMAAVKASR